MGSWGDAFDRLINQRDNGASTEELEDAASKELDKLLDE